MAKPAKSLMTLDELEGWLTFGEAAEILGVSLERIRQLATTDNQRTRLHTAKRIGQRPTGIVREVEIRERKRQRDAAAAAAASEAAAALAEQIAS